MVCFCRRLQTLMHIDHSAVNINEQQSPQQSIDVCEVGLLTITSETGY